MVYKERVSFSLVWQYFFYIALIVAFVSGSFTGIYSLVSTVIARNYINKGEYSKAYNHYRAHFGTFISSKLLDQANEERRIAVRKNYEKEKDEHEKRKAQNPPSPTPTANPEESLLEATQRLSEKMKNYKSPLTFPPPPPPERRYYTLATPVSFSERLFLFKDIGAFSFLIFLSFVFLLFSLCVLKLLHWGYFRIFLVRAVKNRLNNEEKD